jgi:hypothetical protein
MGRYVQQEHKPKEEKPTGGVAQHLDYEMDVMTLFVTEMTQEVVNPTTDPSSSFRKYVSQILSSTRLPSSTIMLGLFYMSSRLKVIAENQIHDVSSRNVYQMLTTGLLLGSKFLDDNTFQNRSWSEVSSIPVHDLNRLELDWLKGFKWEIHRLMYDEDEGFFQWVDHWHAYEKKAKAAKVKDMQKLAPLETNLHRSYSIQHQDLMSPDGPIPTQYQQTSQYEGQWGRQYVEYSPPSAPHSGPATPEYYPNQWTYPQTSSCYGRQAWNTGSAYPTSGQVTSFQQTPTYPSYGYQSWAGHGPTCGCTLCAKSSDYYFNQGGYGMQTVVG